MDRLERQPVDVEALSAYLDGELSETERAAVEARLAADPAWQAELASLRWSVSLVRDTPDAPLPRSFELPVPAAMPKIEAEAADSARRTWSWLYGALRVSAGVAAVLLVLVIAADAYQGFRPARPTPTAMSSAPRSAADSAQAPAPAAAPASAPEAANPTSGGVSAFGAPAPTPAAKAAAAPAAKAAPPIGTAAVGAAAAAQSAGSPAATAPPAAKAAGAGVTAATPEAAARSVSPYPAPPSAAETIPIMAVTPPPEPGPAFPWRAVEIALAALALALIAAALLMRQRT